MSLFFRLDGKNLISVFITDRVAAGLGYELIRGEFASNFGFELTREQFDDYCVKYAADIDRRREELRELIYKSGTYSKLITISDTLFNMIQQGGAPKEVSALAATLRGYLETMSNIGIKNESKVIRQQNNFLIFRDLEREKVIKIIDDRRLKYLVDGEKVEDSEGADNE